MHLKVDGVEVVVPPGTTVKEAALAAGVKIPGLCDLFGLKPYGGCRLCLVEVEGVRGFPSSCTMPANEGMVVKTKTPALMDLRRSILEMLLAEHPNTCLTCERAGKCDEIRVAMRKVPQTMGCRYCPKDRRCELQETVELVGLEKIELPHLSSIKEVFRSPFFDRDPNLCILCGRCVRACEERGFPVISFTLRGFEAGIGTAFDKPLEEIGCRFCGACVDVCPTGALVERGGRWEGEAEEIIKTTCPYCSSGCQIDLEVRDDRLLRARPDGSKLCVRGRFGLQFVHSRDRLRMPLVKKKGRLVPASWEEALNRAADGLRGYSGNEFALITSGVCTNETLYMARRFAEKIMKSKAVASDGFAFGGLPSDLGSSRTVLILGDLAATNPGIELALRSAAMLNIIVISPIKTSLTIAAKSWLKPRPGFEASLLSALTMAVLRKGINEDKSGVPVGEIEDAAEQISGVNIVLGPEFDCQKQVAEAASILAATAGGNLFLPGRNCNSRGAADLGLNNGYEETIKALSGEEIKTAYIIGSNPAIENAKLADSLSKLNFLVVQDLFLTETARLADVVLPASSFAEVDGTFTASDGSMLMVRKAVKAVGSSRPDWQIIADLARKMGGTGFEYADQEAVSKDISSRIKPEKSGVNGSKNEPMFEVSGPSKSEVKFERAEGKKALTLISAPSLFQFGTGTRTSKVSDLRYLNRDRIVEISYDDALDLGISDGDMLALKPNSDSSNPVKFNAKAKISRRAERGMLLVYPDKELRGVIPKAGFCQAEVKVEVMPDV